jgi:hypothetical protein
MRHYRKSNQSGIVSIIVTMIMMIVITLIVIGFTQVTNRNQREALDSQLGTQAYYAAETGVNDIITSINNGLVPTTTGCNSFTARTATGTNITLPRVIQTVGGASTAATTCIMVDPDPTSLELGNIGPSSSKQWHVLNANGVNFGQLTFSWQADAGGSGSTTCNLPQYPVPSAWTSTCGYAMLRVDILKWNQAAPVYDAAGLANNTVTLYLKPSTSSNTVNVGSITSPKAVQGNCNVSGGNCVSNISLAGSAQSSEYYIRVSAIYESTSKVVLTGKDADTGSRSRFSQGQFVIDSTGKAQDQIKRIQVRVPYAPSSGSTPNYALQSTDTICKLLSVTSSSVVNKCDPGWLTVTSPVPSTLENDPSNIVLEGAIDQGSGDSDGTTCTVNCVFWSRNFHITVAPAATITSCTWDWDDGTSKNESPSNCTVGSTETHSFPKILTCTRYNVTLTFHTSAGDKTTQSQLITEPHGADSSC